MPLSRRSFLRSGATAVFTTAAALQAAPLVFARTGAKPGESAQSPLPKFKRENFEPYIGGTFRVSAGTRTLDMKLTKVRGHKLSAGGRKLTKRMRPSDSFALVFAAGSTLTGLTTIYNVEHAALGKFALFLTRRDNPSGGYFYEAVFNHA